MKIAIKALLIIIFITGFIGLSYFGWLNIGKVLAANENASNTEKTKPPVKINEKKMLKALDVLRKRPALSKKDKDAKAKIVDLLSKKKTPYYLDYEIEYIKPADEFLVGIRGLDTQRAKYWATMWFKLNGVTDEGLCKLPVIFYLMPNVANKIKVLNIEFDPIPQNCQ